MKRKSDVVLSGSGAASASSAEGQHVVDTLTIQPLGAGQEVGRSCIILRHKNKTIMLDCGIHPGMKNMDAMPFFDAVDLSEVDLLLVSHWRP